MVVGWFLPAKCCPSARSRGIPWSVGRSGRETKIPRPLTRYSARTPDRMSDAGFELRPWVSLPMGQTIERASERAVPRPFDDGEAHPSASRSTGPCAMIRRLMLMIAHRLLLSLVGLLAVAAPAGAAEVARIDEGRLFAND